MLEQIARDSPVALRLPNMVLEDSPREGAVRVDLAWQLFFDSKPSIPSGHSRLLLPFTNWLWDELGRKAGSLNKSSQKEVYLTVPQLDPQSLDFLIRILSFWSNDIRTSSGGAVSDNLWTKPVVNVYDDKNLDAAEKSMIYKDDSGVDRFFMPILGPGRAFFRVELIKDGESSARFHSHSACDEYYLILEGKGTLRFNDNEEEVGRGDLIGKPAGPDATSQLVADLGESLRVLDMEVWHERPYASKDFVVNPDFSEIMMRGPGWGALVPIEALIGPEDFRKHYDEGYVRKRDGSWAPSKVRGHRKVREKPIP